jgi:uncharacterized protein HemX
MARNRKHQTTAVRFGPAIYAILLCAVIALAGVGYVWQKSRIDSLSKLKKERETRLKELVNTNEKLRNTLATMQTVSQIERRIAELKLGLVPATPNQILILAEPASDGSAAMRTSQFAMRPDALRVP